MRRRRRRRWRHCHLTATTARHSLRDVWLLSLIFVDSPTLPAAKYRSVRRVTLWHRRHSRVQTTHVDPSSFQLHCSLAGFIIVPEYVFYVFQNPKTRLFTFLKCHVKKRNKSQKTLSKFLFSQRQSSLFFSNVEIADTFAVKQLHTLSCYTYNIHQ